MRDPRDPGIDPNTLLIAAAIGLALFLVAGLLFAHELPAGAKLDPRDALAVSQRAVGTTLGDYTLQDHDGRPLRIAAMRGRPLVVQFVYTGCFDVCPTATRFLRGAVAEAQRALGADAFHVVTVGFNQPFDNPAAMREFQRRHALGVSNWVFASADHGTIDALARDTGFSYVPTVSGFDHLTQLTIVDAEGRVYRQVYGESFALPLLVDPLRELVSGAPASRWSVEQLLDDVRILCTVYDPRTGAYRLNYALLIEIFAGLSVLGAVALYVGNEWRRQRRVRPS
jgi:protein SCO1/2